MSSSGASAICPATCLPKSWSAPCCWRRGIRCGSSRTSARLIGESAGASASAPAGRRLLDSGVGRNEALVAARRERAAARLGLREREQRGADLLALVWLDPGRRGGLLVGERRRADL